MQGSGTYAYPSGDVYQGAFLAGKRHGKGMYHYKASACQVGTGGRAGQQGAYARGAGGGEAGTGQGRAHHGHQYGGGEGGLAVIARGGRHQGARNSEQAPHTCDCTHM